MLRDRGPLVVKTVCLLDKPSRREILVPVDYTGFTIEDRFVVGYGLDFNEQHRNLPYVGVIEVE
jgi:hypoxanthine phosphoribosyltransferase